MELNQINFILTRWKPLEGFQITVHTIFDLNTENSWSHFELITETHAHTHSVKSKAS